MIVAGLTGSIAMGKSTVASLFKQFGTPVFDADAAVREFYAGDGAIAVEKMFPGALIDGRIDRGRLSDFVLRNVAALNELELLVHPIIAVARTRFVDRAARAGRRLVVLDIPLLLETSGESAVDIILVVSTTDVVQRERALARQGMTERKLDAILSRQMSDLEKRQRAHFTIDSSGDLKKTRAEVGQFLRSASGMDRYNDCCA